MKRSLNIRQKLVVVVMDVLLLTELSVSLYLACQDPENLTEVFLRTYIPCLLVTVWTARRWIRRWETLPAGEVHAAASGVPTVTG